MFTSYDTDECPPRYYNVCCITGYGDVSLEEKCSCDSFDIFNQLATDDNVTVSQLLPNSIYEVSVCVGVYDVCVRVCVCASYALQDPIVASNVNTAAIHIENSTIYCLNN